LVCKLQHEATLVNERRLPAFAPPPLRSGGGANAKEAFMYSERASHYFKCGYNAVLYAHLDKLPMPSNPHHPGTFAHYDWSEGASACNAALRHAKRK